MSELDGPRATRSLRSRGAPLAAPETQLAILDALGAPSFADTVRGAGLPELRAHAPRILQLNLGPLCNMTCAHCHVDAGPDRADEAMSRETMRAALALLDRLPSVTTVDLTGGAPELNPSFAWLVGELHARGRAIIDRCNLTVLMLGRSEGLVELLAAHDVEVVCSLPHWRRLNTDKQRGDGTFERSIAALRKLNAAGYGRGDAHHRLTLMHNPAGAFLPSAIPAMERAWRDGLQREHGVSFDRLIALNNMPIARFLEGLERAGRTADYLALLTGAFNPAAVAGLMCRDTLSVSWDGRLFDCDFNQMLDLPIASAAPTLTAAQPHELDDRAVVTRQHCYGCTAGAGSSCGGATA